MDSRNAQPDAEARALLQVISRLDEQLAKKPDDLRVLEMRAKAAERLERWEDAAQVWQSLVKAARGANDRPLEARACLQAGIALSRADQPNKGVGFLQRATAAFELLRDEPMTARARMEQARHHLSQGEDGRARPLLELAAPGLEAAAAWEELGWVHRQLSQLALAAGGPAAGLESARLAVEAAARAKSPPQLGERLMHLAALHQANGAPAKARSYLERALPPLRLVRGRTRLLAAYQDLVALARAEGDRSGEERWLTEAVIAADLTRNQSAQGRLRVELAGVIGERAPDRAVELAKSGIERLQRSGDPHGVALGYATLGRLLASRDPATARHAWSRALDFFRMVGDDAGATEVTALAAAAGP